MFIYATCHADFLLLADFDSEQHRYVCVHKDSIDSIQLKGKKQLEKSRGKKNGNKKLIFIKLT